MNSSNHINNKSVKFDQVFIHEFPVILGDNPSVSKGAPLTIDWNPVSHDVVDLDIFEYMRQPERRHRKKMILSNTKRARILMNAGYSIDEIAEMTLQVEDAKRSRAEHALEAVNHSGNPWNLKNNIMDLLSGAAEGTGRTLFLAPNVVLQGATATGQAVGKVGREVVKGTGKVVVGTGKVATDVVVGTGKLGYNVVATTGKVTTDIAVGTVKGTGKVVVGASKATTGVVVGAGKLGYSAVKQTGKRMSKFMNLNDSAAKVLDLDDLGYEDADASPSLEYPPDESPLSSSRRASNGESGVAAAAAKGVPAPQRMPRRGSANGSAALVATRTSSGSQRGGKSKRRGSGNAAALAESFTNFFAGRGRRYSNDSGCDQSVTSPRRSPRRAKSGGKAGGSGRRRATISSAQAASVLSPRSKSAGRAKNALGGNFSELAQMEQFLSYVRDSDPSRVNPVIGHVYTTSQSSLDYDNSDEDCLSSLTQSPVHKPPRAISRSRSAPDEHMPTKAEPVTPAA